MEEETPPLAAANAGPPRRLDSSAVDDLREQLAAAQQKLGKALKLRRQASQRDKNAGSVDVDFVKTKPGNLRCKKDVNVKTILHEFHADFPEGCVTALMGPSGAGKTTLLDFLTGMLGDGVRASGQVALPDNDAYVPQDDRLHAFFSCKTYMEHYARLSGMSSLFDCCGKKKGDAGGDGDEEGATPQDGADASKDVDALIASILGEVGLAKQTNTVVGGMFTRGLSGGQKRRLSVALEALSSPLNLFLDEPTSGLDSESALALMTYLQSYARGRDPATGRRRRVIVTIHQPSSQIWDEMIDNVVLLAEGRLMYQGRRSDMDDFFGAYGHPVPMHYNPADHVIEVLFKEPIVGGGEADETPEKSLSSIEMWSECFEKWSNPASPDASMASRPKLKSRPSLLSQRGIRTFGVVRTEEDGSKRAKVKAVAKKNYRGAIELTRRSFVSLLKNPVVLGLRMAIYGGMSLMIGILFFDLESKTDLHSIQLSRTALLYFVIAFCSSMSVAVIPFAMLDRGIVEKEVRNHLYHPAFYHVAQALASIPACIILSILTWGIIYGMTGIMAGSGPALILFLTFVCADATSMFVSQIAPELISAICIASGIFGVFTMVMGFLVTPSKMPDWIAWLYYVPFMTYAFRSLMYIEYVDLRVPLEEVAPEDSPYGDLFGGADTSALEGAAQQFGVGEDQRYFEGTMILKQFEMEDVNVSRDMVILAVWAVIMHLVTLSYLIWSKHKSRRTFVYSDGD